MDDQYIKMVRALPDKFFEGWEWKDGDRFVLEYNSPYNMKVHYVGDAVVYRSKVYDIEITSDDIRSLLGDARPLPSQAQLQKMCLEDGEDFDPELLYVFSNWVYSPMRKVVFNSMESAWLQYIMWIFHTKTWDGEAWI